MTKKILKGWVAYTEYKYLGCPAFFTNKKDADKYSQTWDGCFDVVKAELHYEVKEKK